MGRETGVALPSARDAAHPRPALTEIGFRSPSGLTCLALGGGLDSLEKSLLIDSETLCGALGSALFCSVDGGGGIELAMPLAVPEENIFILGSLGGEPLDALGWLLLLVDPL